MSRIGLVTINADGDDTFISDFEHDSTVQDLPTGGGGDGIAFADNGFTDLVVANQADGLFDLITGGPNGPQLAEAIASSAVPNPSAVQLASVSSTSISIYATNVGTEAVFNLTFDLKPAEAHTELLPLENSILAATLVVGAAPTEPAPGETSTSSTDTFTTTNFVVGISTATTNGATGTDGTNGSGAQLRVLLDQWSAAWQMSVHQVSTSLTVIEQGTSVLLKTTVDLGQQTWSTLGLDGSEALLWDSVKSVWSVLGQTGRQVIQVVPRTLQQLRGPDAIVPPPGDGAAANDGPAPAGGLLPPELLAGAPMLDDDPASLAATALALDEELETTGDEALSITLVDAVFAAAVWSVWETGSEEPGSDRRATGNATAPSFR